MVNIPSLTALAATPASGDEIEVYDTSAAENKRLALSYLVATSGTQATVTGGGTVALAGYTLTVPATGTAALRGAANTFSAAQTIAVTSGNGLRVENSATGLVQTQLASTSATGAGNYPTLEFRANTSTTERSMASLRPQWITTTDATRASKIEFYTNKSGTFAANMTLYEDRLLVDTSTDDGGPLTLGTPTARLGIVNATTTGSTKASPGTVNAWIEWKIGGSTYYTPAYTSKTS